MRFLRFNRQNLGVGKADRRAFAIVLVAALAGLIFLMGASLVVVSQLQTAVVQHDSRERVAKDNARAALEMAVADLQRYAGKDQVVTYNANIMSTNDEALGTKRFWSASYSTTDETERWLVTRRIGGLAGFGLSDPVEVTGNVVVLVGEGSTGIAATSGSVPSEHVEVPKQPIAMHGIFGFDGSGAADGSETGLISTVGHYAYWVGDLGTKASYMLRDRRDDIDYAPYLENNDRLDRLPQLRMDLPSISELNPDETGEAENKYIIDNFVNDFQLRAPVGASDNANTILNGLSIGEVKNRFHDFTALTRGLLTNSIAVGDESGFRHDLSLVESKVGSELGDLDGIDGWDAISPYLRWPIIEDLEFSNPDRLSYKMSGRIDDLPQVVPVVTEVDFGLSINVQIEIVGGVPNLAISLSHKLGLELWNPYTSGLHGVDPEIVIRGTPRLEVSVGDLDPVVVGLEELGLAPRYRLSELIGDVVSWRAGQIHSFFGTTPSSYMGLTRGEFIGATGSLMPLVRVPIGVVLGDLLSVELSLGGIEIEIYTSESVNPLAVFKLQDDLAYSRVTADTLTAEVADVPATVGVFPYRLAWAISDEMLPFTENYHPLNFKPESGLWKSIIGMNALSPSIFVEDLESEDVGFLPSSNTILLGDTDMLIERDIPITELPRQDIASIGQLRFAQNTNSFLPVLGNVNSGLNHYFDEYFFSTFSSEMTAGSDTLPNSNYRWTGLSEDSVLEYDKIAQHFYVDGMFNVHSTSVAAWTALLKAYPSVGSLYAELDPTGYLFFNYPQTAEFLVSLNEPSEGTAEIDLKRFSMRQGVIVLSGDEVEELAIEIVSNIRRRVSGVEPYGPGNMGPFLSLRDFLDSGVLARSILEVGINPGWELPNSAYHFNQATIMNALAPYLSVRSDTFLVRAYGDAVNPASPDEIWSRAYCEAIVQRVHAKHSSEIDQDVMSPTGLNPGEFGRQFKIVAFRWLSPSEI